MDWIYLDHAATTPLAPEVRAAMEPFLGPEYGNPSSRHALGVRAARALEDARARVAKALGANAEGVVFTSGGTEANNLAVLGLARARRKHGRHVLIGPTEHPSVRGAALALVEEGFEVESASVTSGGALDLDDLARRLRTETVLVAQMLVSNEFGTIYPLARVARAVRGMAPRAALHVDAVQALGKIDVSLAELGADSLAISAHKVNGPKGVGALLLARGVRPRPILVGGEQERGLRSGTENPCGAVALARAVELAVERRSATHAHLVLLRERLSLEIARIPGVRILEPGGSAALSPAIVALRLPGPPAEAWQHQLEAHGVLTSVGSACQAHKRGASSAALALGIGEAESKQVLRVSFARTTTQAEVLAACAALSEVERALGASTP